MKRISPCLVIALAVLLLPSCQQHSPLEELHAPVVTESSVTSTGLETRWSRVKFGHYPAREVVGQGFDNVDGYAYEDADLRVDGALLERLSSAEWKEGKMTIDNVSYRRIPEPSSPSSKQHYTYDDPGKKYHYFECEPITWRVLSLDGSKATLMADKALECLDYHFDESGARWKDSYVRAYLNSLDLGKGKSFAGAGFLSEAFSEKEQSALLKHASKESINKAYDISSGEACEDYVYLLDHDEMFDSPTAASYGFYQGHGYDDPAKRFKSTMYAKFQGCWYSPVTGYRGNCFHFMRTPGYKNSYVSYICDFGYIYSRGTSVTCFDAGIVPVIDVDLGLLDWTKETERSSTWMVQDSFGGDEEEGESQSKWEMVDYGQYPQSEVPSDDPRCAKLEGATWEEDETILDGIRYRRNDRHYYEFEPISWRILEKEGDSALLFSSIGLDCLPFHGSLSNVVWSDSDVRKYLNDDFLAMAFREGGDEAILTRKIANRPNHYFGTDCGQDTFDKAFLLCEDDMFGGETAKKHGFAPSDATNDEARRIVPSDYALGRGAWVSKDGNGFYSLRNSGYSNTNAVYVGELGDIYNRGIPVTCSDMTLVPAMWVDITKLP